MTLALPSVKYAFRNHGPQNIKNISFSLSFYCSGYSPTVEEPNQQYKEVLWPLPDGLKSLQKPAASHSPKPVPFVCSTNPPSMSLTQASTFCLLFPPNETQSFAGKIVYRDCLQRLSIEIVQTIALRDGPIFQAKNKHVIGPRLVPGASLRHVANPSLHFPFPHCLRYSSIRTQSSVGE